MPTHPLPPAREVNDRVNGPNWVDGASSSFVWFGYTHVGANAAYSGGFIFDIPTDGSIDLDNITNTVMTADPVQNNTAGVGGWLTVIPAPIDFANSNFNRPRDQYDNTHGEIDWSDDTDVVIGERVTTPDLTALLVSALAAATDLGGYKQVALIDLKRTDIGVRSAQVASSTHTSASAPALEISTSGPPNYTADLGDGLDITAHVGPVVPADIYPDTDPRSASAAGTGFDGKSINSVGRSYDLWIPLGTPPAGGWPLIAWTHSGFWSQGSKAQIPSALIGRALSAGFAIASVAYNKTKLSALNWDKWWSFPMQSLDYKVSLAHMMGAGHNIDTARVYWTGYSAGGHTAAFAAFSNDYADGTIYAGHNGNASMDGDRRHTTYNQPQQLDYQFTFNETGTLTGVPPVAGLFLWGTPIDVQVTVADMGHPDGHRWARNALMGNLAASNASTDHDEADLNHYLVGSNTVDGPYQAGVQAAPSFPIGYVEGNDGNSWTDDGIIPHTAGAQALHDALDTTGYDVSTPVQSYSKAGFTHLQVDTHHDDLDDHLDELFLWIATVEAPEVSGPTWHGISPDGQTYEDYELVGTVSSDGATLNTDDVEYVGQVSSSGTGWTP